jgi:hypothetical protein
MRCAPIAFLLMGFAGCGPKSAAVVPTQTRDSGITQPTTAVTTKDTADTVTTRDTGHPPLDTGPFKLTGTVPPVALAAIDFTGVLNEKGEERTKADLLGHPTVLWFYPAAETGG